MDRYNILIVDDENRNIQLLINILKQNKNYNLIFAVDGQQALDRIKEHDFDLILLDIVMEPMDGYEVCKIIKKDSILKKIPIIFLTAKNDEESIKKGFDLGAVDYITKPFFEAELLARVRTHLELKSYRDELEDEIKLKDKLMFQQSKMATIGEMLENIVHQWKQPLSVLSMISANVKVDHELGMEVDDEKLMNVMDEILSTTHYLSQTMDDFKNFFAEKEKVVFKPNDLVNKVLNLLNSKLKKGYNVVRNIEDIEITGLENELAQVFMTIINNSIDALQDIDEKIIMIDINKNSDNFKISIKDNGGGVSQNILTNVFEKYFTTKGDNGTGIGLYMTKNIINKHFNGTITAHNTNFRYEDNEYCGVEFIIEVPLDTI